MAWKKTNGKEGLVCVSNASLVVCLLFLSRSAADCGQFPNNPNVVCTIATVSVLTIKFKFSERGSLRWSKQREKSENNSQLPLPKPRLLDSPPTRMPRERPSRTMHHQVRVVGYSDMQTSKLRPKR
ncbi:hypothetical protein B0T20DRAFT_100110 [Sordaria brevicollis]|uniref:Secreted protein n=1 Tax=Sordaria brevicollis TaxID=83679 RepID=A0AAE0U2Y7_SORBR|nr:hypothetical protein B0T20DRAFT_100110 [Sordaria brevicollis]